LLVLASISLSLSLCTEVELTGGTGMHRVEGVFAKAGITRVDR
jgi:hypothetical protein